MWVLLPELVWKSAVFSVDVQFSDAWSQMKNQSKFGHGPASYGNKQMYKEELNCVGSETNRWVVSCGCPERQTHTLPVCWCLIPFQITAVIQLVKGKRVKNCSRRFMPQNLPGHSQLFFILWILLCWTQNSLFASLTASTVTVWGPGLGSRERFRKFTSGCLWLGVISNFK